MSHFLWVEDFENNVMATTNDVFGKVFPANAFPTEVENRYQMVRLARQQGIVIKLTFQDALRFIQSPQLQQIDYIVLDIDLQVAEEGEPYSDSVLGILKKWYDYPDDVIAHETVASDAAYRLKSHAGYLLYIELLIQQRFPYEHILFCSNHGDNLKSIQDAFEGAKIDLPRIYRKRDQDAGHWVLQASEQPYSVLRRAMLEGCRTLGDRLGDPKRDTRLLYRFHAHHLPHQLPSIQDFQNHLQILESQLLPFLVLAPIHRTARFRDWLNLLVRDWANVEWRWLYKYRRLDHPTDNGVYTLGCLLKTLRNWTAHEATSGDQQLLKALDEVDMAFLFMANIRATFDLDEALFPYEQALLWVTDAEDPMSAPMGYFLPADPYERVHRIYSQLESQFGQERRYQQDFEHCPAVRCTPGDFSRLINLLQRIARDHPDIFRTLLPTNFPSVSRFFITSLYQMFWYQSFPHRLGETIDLSKETGMPTYLISLAAAAHPRAFLLTPSEISP